MNTALSCFLLVALAAPATAQSAAKPAPHLPPVLPDVKIAASTLPQTAPLPRAEPTRVQPGARVPKPPDAAASDAASVIDFSRVHFDEPGDGRLWARARNYKASFDATGATFIPFLGSQAPRNFPVHVELARASVGGTELPLESRSVTRAGHAVTIDRGALREVWHVDLDSAEQTFELAARPAAAGDVRLVLRLESELALRADGAGFALEGPNGGVRIGAATAVDAGGRRLELAARLEAGDVVIDVPETFVRAARFPLVVDPVYTTDSLEGFTNECALPDVTNKGTNGEYSTVLQYAYSATDADLWAVDLYFGLPVAGSGTWVDSSVQSWNFPRTAYNALYDTILTTAQVRATPSSPSEIWCRARQAGSNAQYAPHLIQNASLGQCFYADVGGDPSLTGPTYFLTAWTRAYLGGGDWDVHARLINWDGTPVGGTIFLENSTSVDWRPSVSKTNGRSPYATQNWNVVWTRDTTQSNLDILGAQVLWDGTLTTPAFVVDASTWTDQYPSASSPLDAAQGPRPWMVAFQRWYGNDHDVIVKVFQNDTPLVEEDLSILEGADPFEDQIQPDVDSNGQRFVVAYSETYTGNQSDHDAYFAVVAHDENGIRVDESHVNFDFSFRDTYGIQIACGMNATNYGFAIYGLVWQRYGAGNGDVFSGACYEPQTVDSFCAGDGSAGACPCGNVGAFGRGCANSATNGAYIYPSGEPWVTYDTFHLQALNLPSSAMCIFLQGSSSAPMKFGDGLRCVGGDLLRLAVKAADAGGFAAYPDPGELPISVQGGVPVVGGQRAYQVMYRDGLGFCTQENFNLSSGIRATWLR